MVLVQGSIHLAMTPQSDGLVNKNWSLGNKAPFLCTTIIAKTTL